MNNPLISIIIPTHNRPRLVSRAVNSALEQTIDDLEVIVVDDGSEQPPELPSDPRVRLISQDKARGGAAARNVGTKAACGRWVTYLDDDDRLLPHMVDVSLKALSEATLPNPVAVISGIELVTMEGKVKQQRLPPSVRLRGAYFSLEKLELGYSYNTKQTLVVEREVIEQIGGWDESFRSRVHSELFLRLNPACSIIGLPVITYQLTAHEGDRVSQNLDLRQESFHRLIRKHEFLFKSHPQMFAEFLYNHAMKSYELGQINAAFFSACRSMQVAPIHVIKHQIWPYYERLFNNLSWNS